MLHGDPLSSGRLGCTFAYGGCGLGGWDGWRTYGVGSWRRTGWGEEGWLCVFGSGSIQEKDSSPYRRLLENSWNSLPGLLVGGWRQATPGPFGQGVQGLFWQKACPGRSGFRLQHGAHRQYFHQWRRWARRVILKWGDEERRWSGVIIRRIWFLLWVCQHVSWMFWLTCNRVHVPRRDIG